MRLCLLRWMRRVSLLSSEDIQCDLAADAPVEVQMLLNKIVETMMYNSL